MKRMLLALLLCWLLAAPLLAVDEVNHVARVLRELAELPGVSGYEEEVSQWLMARLKEHDPHLDSLGNVTVTLGSGAPHRLLITPIDEPGYVVSAITPDGYLRVQRLPQAGVNPWFDLLHSTQPVQILTRKGELVPGVVAGLSTHLHRDLGVGDRTDNPDRLYIDVGARSVEEVRALGVDLLDPITLEKRAHSLAQNQLTAPFIGERFGAAALVRLIEGMDATKLTGTLTVAFVARRYLGHQGLEHIVRENDADEVILIQRLEKSEAGPGAKALVASLDGGAPALAADLLAVARQYGLARAELAEAWPRGRYTGAVPFPERTAVVGVAVKFPQTPAEIVSTEDVTRLEELLALYLGITIGQAPAGVGPGSAGGMTDVGPGNVDFTLRKLSPVYGVSGHEEPVVEEIRSLLPAWAQEWAFTDAEGNLILPFGKQSDKPTLVFVAHMDEIGWVVKEIRDDGRLVLARRGGFLEEHFLGHAVLIHTGKGVVPAVLELPEKYQTEKYQFVRDREHIAYTGARTRDWVEQQGVRVGDSVTVPKKFRKLAGSRVSARSFDDRVGCTALVSALYRIDPAKLDREVVFVWSVREEVGLEGARHFADRAAEEDAPPDFVFAVDTFVSGDSPLESPRFAQARLGEGFVVRAVDNSNVTPRRYVDRVVEIARNNRIPVQYGVTAGGNDGAVFVPHDVVDIPLGWPLRYSHSPGEVADLKDVEALARIVAALVKEW
ncbi:MAG TPA: M20/M25/M40 family metallo-hydrolase [Candidatus Xenobia bacterium]|nr:M20/M25/M40 family metallo-hydrolase [Candidatus Xenobia bacterium]